MSLKKRKASAKVILYKKVYLAGSCEASTEFERTQWRKCCEKWFDLHAIGISVINPVVFYDYSRRDFHRDSEVLRFFHHKIKEATVVLVNLNNIRKSVGTICELAWAYEHNIPIVGFYENSVTVPTEELQREMFHSWIVDICNRIEVGSNAMEEAMKYIDYYYG